MEQIIRLDHQIDFPRLRFIEFINKWQDIKLDELCIDLSSGKSKSNGNNGEYPLYGSRGVIQHSGVFDYSGKKILIARVGANAGDLYIVDGHYCVSDNTLILNLKNDVSLDFIFYYLINFNLNKLVFGSGQPLITSGQLKRIKIKRPSLPEQTKIASFLTTVDQKIQSLKKKKSLLEEYKKGIMQKLFSQELRFKDEKGNEFPGWETAKLNNLGVFFSGGTPPSTNKSYYGGEIPFIRSGEIGSNTTELYLSKSGLNNSSAKLIMKGDLLYALYGATSGEVAISKIDGAINQAILCIRISNVDNRYIKYYFINYKTRILKTYLQGGQGNLSADIIKSLVLPLPNSSEIYKMVQFLSFIEKKIEITESQLQKLESWKKGLLQKMFC